MAPCFEGESGPEAVSIAEHLCAANIAAEAASTSAHVNARLTLPVYLVVVGSDDLPRATAWLQSSGYGESQRIHERNVRRLTPSVLWGLAIFVVCVLSIFTVSTFAFPVGPIVAMGTFSLFILTIGWRRDSERSRSPSKKPPSSE